MNAKIVNLRRHRKRKLRESRETVAAENRAKFGRSKAETNASAARDALANRHLLGHRRDIREPED
jgi:hypothetical protein